jgi:sugar lactone lactonase YvrE
MRLLRTLLVILLMPMQPRALFFETPLKNAIQHLATAQVVRALVAFLVLAAWHPTFGMAQVISRYLGGGLGDGLPALSAKFTDTGGMAFDRENNLYIIDEIQQKIRKIDARTNVVSTVAGNGSRTFSGDGGLATNAGFSGLRFGIAADSARNLYVTDGPRIRRISAATGLVTTVAGGPTDGFSGDGGPASQARIYSGGGGIAISPSGDIYFADAINRRVRKIAAASGVITTVAGNGLDGSAGDGGPAATASIGSYPYGIALDSRGNVYVRDGVARVRKIDVSNNIISTVAGNGSNGYSGDGGPATQASIGEGLQIAIDAFDNLFISDYRNVRLRKVNLSSGVISTAAGIGPCASTVSDGVQVSAACIGVTNVAVDSTGNIFVSTPSSTPPNRIYKIGISDGVVRRFAGGGSCLESGKPLEVCLLRNTAIAIDSRGDLLVSDSGNYRVYRVDQRNESVSLVAGNGNAGYSGDNGPAISAAFTAPSGVASDAQGNVYIADGQTHRIRVVMRDSGTISPFAGSAGSTFSDGGFSGDGGLAANARLSTPGALAVDKSGNVIVVDSVNRRIRRISAATRRIETIAGSGATDGCQLAGISGDGGPATAATLGCLGASGLALDSSGNVMFFDTDRVRRINAVSGIIDSVPGTTVARPNNSSLFVGLAIDGADNLYYAPVPGYVVRRLSLKTGETSVVAGTGQIGDSGDGGLATNALLNGFRNDLAVDQVGNLFISNNTSATVRKVAPAPIPTTPQVISFGPIPNRLVSGGTFTLSASASSALPVTFSSLTSTVCTVSGFVVTSVAVGTCTVAANQSGNATFSAAQQVTQSFQVNAGNPPSPAVRGAIDLDGNGRNAFLLRSATAQMLVGRFTNGVFQFSPLTDPGSAFRLVGVGDFDGNGKSDLAFQNTTQGELGDIKIWKDFSPSNEIYWRQVKQVWDVQATGDLDGDGFSDVVWRYVVNSSPDTGVSYIWFTNGSSVTQVRKRGGAPLDWQLLGAADLNGDRAADMVYINPAGQIRVLMATPGRTCANVLAGSIPAGYSALKLADFTGSGRAEILLKNSAGQIQLLALNASGLVLPPYTGAPDDQNAACTSTSLSLSTDLLALPNVDLSWQYYVSGDFDGDGIADIVWLRTDGTLAMWRMNPGVSNGNATSPAIWNDVGTAPPGYSVFSGEKSGTKRLRQ